jgi:tight adherence protein C
MDPQFLIPVAILFIAVGAATAAGAWVLTDPQVVRRRLSGLSPAPAQAGVAASVVEEGLSPLAAKLRSWVPKSPKEMGRIERMMANAGYFGTLPALLFATVQLVLPVVVFAAIMAYARTSGALLIAGVAAMLAYFTPT